MSKPKPVKEDGCPFDTGDWVKLSNEGYSKYPFSILNFQLIRVPPKDILGKRDN